MLLLDLTLATLPANLALDEALLLQAEEGHSGEHLRFWEWPSLAVVLGASGQIAKDVDVEACQQDGVPIVRRSSGGGTVLLGAGCLCFSLILATERALELREVNSSYRYILMRMLTGLKSPESRGTGLRTDVRLEFAGICDLILEGKKFSGNAQQRKQRFILHHGTILYQFPWEKITQYLKMPDQQPEYRQQRSHSDFVTNLPIPLDLLKQQIRTTWEASEETTTWPNQRVEQLLQEKYAVEEWIYRR